MKNKIYKVFSITLPLSLSGCMGIYEGGFECPAGIGVGCKSISDVNKMVNIGEIPKAPPEQPTPEKLEIWYAPSTRSMEPTGPKTIGCPSVIEAKNLRESTVKDVPQSI